MLATMTAKEARAKNLALLVKTWAGGKQRLFADTYGFDASHISQMINGQTMGDSVARKIERLFQMERGAMDRPPVEVSSGPTNTDAPLGADEDVAIRRELVGYWDALPASTKRNLLAMAKRDLAANIAIMDRVSAELKSRMGMVGNATDRRVEETIGRPPEHERRRQKN